MLRKGIFLAATILAMTNSVRAGEPGRIEKINGQRVSPQLLNDALAIPKTLETVLPSPGAVTLDDLTQLAAKLRSSGDLNSAALLERYVREQKPTAANASPVPVTQMTAISEPVWIEIEAFEVSGDDLPNELIMKSYPTAQNIKHIREELGRLVADKKATVLIPLHSLQTQMNQAVNYVERLGEIEVPTPGPNGTTTSEKREAGIKGEITAKIKSNGMIELSQYIEFSRIDDKNAVELQGKSVPGLTRYRIQSVNETIAGQPVLLGHFRGLFVFTTVNPRSTDVILAPPGIDK